MFSHSNAVTQKYIDPGLQYIDGKGRELHIIIHVYQAKGGGGESAEMPWLAGGRGWVGVITLYRLENTPPCLLFVRLLSSFPLLLLPSH